MSIDMVARFLPRGLAGIAYWYTLLQAHQWLFEGMLKTVARRTGKRILDGPKSIAVEDPVVCRLQRDRLMPTIQINNWGYKYFWYSVALNDVMPFIDEDTVHLSEAS